MSADYKGKINKYLGEMNQLWAKSWKIISREYMILKKSTYPVVRWEGPSVPQTGEVEKGLEGGPGGVQEGENWLLQGGFCPIL